MPKASKKAKFYAVRIGRQTGIYTVWDEAERQVKGYPGSLHHAFPTIEGAQTWLGLNPDPTAKPELDLKPDISEGSSLIPASAQFAQLTEGVSGHPKGDAVPALLEVAKIPNPPEPSPPEPTLSEQQSRILGKILNGENFFFTGSAGTGKSVLLRAIIKAFGEKGAAQRKELAIMETKWQQGQGPDPDEVDSEGKPRRRAGGWSLGKTASTGMAAVNIGGCTLHSWGGIGLGEQPKEKLLQMILKNNLSRERWRTTSALLIDEISMIDGDLFDKLEWIGQKVRQNSKPFGGLQIILSGDFFQLPPVAKDNGRYKFAFEADCWSRVIGPNSMLALTRVFRQKENGFVRLLESMRRGKCTGQHNAMLMKCDRPVRYDDDIEPVGLYPSKIEVETINIERLHALDTPFVEYKALDVPGINSKGYPLTPDEATRSLDRNTIWPAKLALKAGAMVMLVTNMQDGSLVNGSTGIVVDFLTIPHAQTQGVHVPGKAVYFSPSPVVLWPVVEFTRSRHATGVYYPKVLIPMMTVDVMNAMGEFEARRSQVPLILAWALTIHKSQGQTIERIRIDLRKIFVEGQTYVAISRAVSLDTCEIRNFKPNKIMAHSRVIKWAKPFEEEQAQDEEWDDLLADADLNF